MGDKSPKQNQKKSSQKQAKVTSTNNQKKQVVADKQAVQETLIVRSLLSLLKQKQERQFPFRRLVCFARVMKGVAQIPECDRPRSQQRSNVQPADFLIYPCTSKAVIASVLDLGNPLTVGEK